MKFRIHPILLPVFLFLIMTGSLSTYAIIFLSLLLHEAGHVLAAWSAGMRIRSCTIMPYGGELVIPGQRTARKNERIRVALGGPLATIVLLLVAFFYSSPGSELAIRIQLALLALNLLPILPLDGGQVLTALLEKKGSEYNTRAVMLIYSMIFLAIAVIILGVSLPKTLPYLFLALFLLIQNIASFRFRRYDKAFSELKKQKG